MGISILDAERKTLAMNAASKAIFDTSTAAPLADVNGRQRYLKTDWSPMSPDEQAIERALKEKQVIRGVETGVVKGDGNVVWTNMSVVPVDFPDWKAVVVTSDITARKRAEDALRESEGRFREIFENMSSGVVVYEAVNGGEDFKINHFNRAAEKIEGISGQSVIGRTVCAAFPGVKTFGLIRRPSARLADGEPRTLSTRLLPGRPHRRLAGKLCGPAAIGRGGGGLRRCDRAQAGRSSAA